MIVVCTKCGTHNDVPTSMAPPFERCKRCGQPFAEQHLHVELSPPPYPKEPSLYPKSAAPFQPPSSVVEGSRPSCRSRGCLAPLNSMGTCTVHFGAPRIVQAPRPVDDTSRASWRKQIAGWLSNESDRARFTQHEFIECNACRAKPGAPSLCAACLANRQTIDELNEQIEKLSAPRPRASGKQSIATIKQTVGKHPNGELELIDDERDYGTLRVREHGLGKASIYLDPEQLDDLALRCHMLAALIRVRR